MRSTTCPRCNSECAEIEEGLQHGIIYECYRCHVDNSLRWCWESVRLWEPVGIEDQPPEDGMVKIILASHVES